MMNHALTVRAARRASRAWWITPLRDEGYYRVCTGKDVGDQDW